MWILAPKLPNSDLQIAVRFGVDFFLLFFLKGKNARKKVHQKIHGKIHPGMCSEKFPSDFCKSLFLIVTRNESPEGFQEFRAITITEIHCVQIWNVMMSKMVHKKIRGSNVWLIARFPCNLLWDQDIALESQLECVTEGSAITDTNCWAILFGILTSNL